MAVTGGFLRTVRFGGAEGRAAANVLLGRARAGALAPPEVAEVKQLLAAPELKDVFHGGLGDALRSALGPGKAPVRDVKALAPNTQALTDPRAIPARFAKDALLMQDQLVDPRLPRAENAQRLMEFFVAYAERFIELVAQSPLAAPQLEKALKQFEKALTETGFRELVDRSTGRDGVAVGRALLDSPSIEELKQQAKALALDAPGWKDPAVMVTTQGREPPPEVASATAEDAQDHRRGRRGKLGSNMLWNALHLLREGAESEEEKEALNALILTAGFGLLFITIVMTVLFITL